MHGVLVMRVPSGRVIPGQVVLKLVATGDGAPQSSAGPSQGGQGGDELGQTADAPPRGCSGRQLTGRRNATFSKKALEEVGGEGCEMLDSTQGEGGIANKRGPLIA